MAIDEVLSYWLGPRPETADELKAIKQFWFYSVDWARKHFDVIVRFGRFPHRNRALGSPLTREEVDFLAYLELAGQWL